MVLPRTHTIHVYLFDHLCTVIPQLYKQCMQQLRLPVLLQRKNCNRLSTFILSLTCQKFVASERKTSDVICKQEEWIIDSLKKKPVYAGSHEYSKVKSMRPLIV